MYEYKPPPPPIIELATVLLLLTTMFLFHFIEYEKLKREKQEAIAKSKQEQLEKLQKDLGHGESVAMETNTVTDQQPVPRKNPEIFLGAGDEADPNIESDEMPEGRQQQQSFERFLTREREKSSNANSS